MPHWHEIRQAIGQVGPAPHLLRQRFEQPVALQAGHVGLSQQIHELVRIVGLEPVVVDLPEEADAMRKRDEIGPVDIDPCVVDVPAPADLGREVMIGQTAEVNASERFGGTDHGGDLLAFDFFAELFEVFEAAVQTQVPGALVAGLGLRTSRDGSGLQSALCVESMASF